MKANYLVCYDIRDERRLQRVYNQAKKVGIHLQYSVFYCRLTWPELLEFKRTLNDIIDESKDDVRFYPLPENPKVTVMGLGDRIPDGIMVFLR